MRWAMAPRAASWPITRWPIRCARERMAWASSASILPTGMPVQPAITAATVRESTCSGTSGSSWRMASRPAARRASSAARWSMRPSSSSSGLAASALSLRGQQFAADVEQFAHRFAFLVPAGLQLADGPAVIARLAFQGGDTRAVVEAGGLFLAQPLQFLLPAPARDGAGFPAAAARRAGRGATRAQAVSSTLIALSGNWRPEISDATASPHRRWPRP